MTATPTRCRYQFSLWALFAVTFVVCCTLGLITRERQIAARQKAVVEAIQNLRGEIVLDKDAPRRSAGMRFLFGDDSFASVTTVVFRRDSSPIESGVRHLNSLTNLEYLSLQGTEMTDAEMRHLSGLMKLKTLFLTRTQITDAGLMHIAGLSNLRELYLEETRITDVGLARLAGLEKLEVLHLYATDVTDKGLLELSAHRKLEFVSLRGTLVTDEGVRRLQNSLPNMKIEQ